MSNVCVWVPLQYLCDTFQLFDVDYKRIDNLLCEHSEHMVLPMWLDCGLQPAAPASDCNCVIFVTCSKAFWTPPARHCTPQSTKMYQGYRPQWRRKRQRLLIKDVQRLKIVRRKQQNLPRIHNSRSKLSQEARRFFKGSEDQKEPESNRKLPSTTQNHTSTMK